MIDPANIVDTADIRQMAGDVSTATMFRWRQRDSFPLAITTTGSGLTLYDRDEVQAWLDDHVVIGRNGMPHVRYAIHH